MKKTAFSLIELMVAVSILSIGIVLIARSFLSASNGLSISENKIAAMSLLESRMCEAQEKALEPEAEFIPVNEEVLINNKKASFRADSQEVRIGKDKNEKFIDKVTLSVSWREGSKSYDEILSTYIEQKKAK